MRDGRARPRRVAGASLTHAARWARLESRDTTNETSAARCNASPESSDSTVPPEHRQAVGQAGKRRDWCGVGFLRANNSLRPLMYGLLADLTKGNNWSRDGANVQAKVRAVARLSGSCRTEGGQGLGVKRVKRVKRARCGLCQGQGCGRPRRDRGCLARRAGGQIDNSGELPD
jgi:hypothetical protein